MTRDLLLTDPDQAADFVKRTQLDALAIAIGTSHGAYKFTRKPTGDILAIAVAGEPDLPQAFTVQSDGTIRFPLIGVIKVIGLTGAQARSAIAKEFRDRKLNGELTVTLRRPRGGLRDRSSACSATWTWCSSRPRS